MNDESTWCATCGTLIGMGECTACLAEAARLEEDFDYWGDEE